MDVRTETVNAVSRNLDGRLLTFEARLDLREGAHFLDTETGARWTIAGKAVDGPLAGKR